MRHSSLGLEAAHLPSPHRPPYMDVISIHFFYYDQAKSTLEYPVNEWILGQVNYNCEDGAVIWRRRQRVLNQKISAMSLTD